MALRQGAGELFEWRGRFIQHISEDRNPSFHFLQSKDACADSGPAACFSRIETISARKGEAEGGKMFWRVYPGQLRVQAV